MLSSIHRKTTGLVGRLGRIKDVAAIAAGLGGQPIMPLPDVQRPAVVSKKETRRGEGGKNGGEEVTDTSVHT